MDSKKEKVLKKVRKLLELSEGKTNENECATAARQAAYLIEKYEIEHSEIIRGELAKDGIYCTRAGPEFNGEPPNWIQPFVYTLAQLFDCDVGLVRVRVDGSIPLGPDLFIDEDKYFIKVVSFIGIEMDCTVVAWTMDYLCDAILRLSKEWAEEKGIFDQEEWITNIFGTPEERVENFKIGAGYRIFIKLKEMSAEKNKRREENRVTTSLVVCKKSMIREALGKDVDYGPTIDYSEHLTQKDVMMEPLQRRI